MKPAIARLVLVTDPAFSDVRTDDVITAVARLLPHHGFAVQLRDKGATDDVLLARARRLRALTTDLGVQLLVNGSTAIARTVGADGAHVPGAGSIAAARSALGDGALITAAAHHDDGVARALREGADAVFVSPVFASPGKGTPCGLAALRSARALVDGAADASARRARRYPDGRCPESASEGESNASAGVRLLVFALGGVDVSNARTCFAAGADGVAVIRALLATKNHDAIARTVDDLRLGLC